MWRRKRVSLLLDMCCNLFIQMTIQFGPRIDREEAVLIYLSAAWDKIHEEMGHAKNQPYIKLIAHLNYLGPANEQIVAYNRLKILFVAKHNAFLFDDLCPFKPISEIPGPAYRWFGHCNRVTKLFIDTSHEINIWPLMIIISNCRYLETLICNKFLPCQIFHHINVACFTSLKSVQILGEAGANFSTQDFLKYFLGIENEMPLYRTYKYFLAVALQAHNNAAQNHVANVPPPIGAEIFAWNKRLKGYLKDLVRASAVSFPNIENIEILSTSIDAAALVLAFIMLPNLTHALVGDSRQLNEAFFLFYFLRTTLQFGIDAIKIKKIQISQKLCNWWVFGQRYLNSVYGFKEIEVYSSRIAPSDILIDIKYFAIFHTVTSLKVNMQYNCSLNSLLIFLQSALSVNHLTELNVESIEASATECLVHLLQNFYFLNTLRLTVQGRGTMGRIFNQMSIGSVQKLYLTAMQPCSTDEMVYILKYFKGAKYVYITLATCTLVSSFAYQIIFNLSNLEILCVKPFCCCYKCSREMTNLRYNSRMQIFAWNLLQRNKTRFIIEAESYSISLDKLDHLKSCGWEIAKGFKMPE